MPIKKTSPKEQSHFLRFVSWSNIHEQTTMTNNLQTQGNKLIIKLMCCFKDCLKSTEVSGGCFHSLQWVLKGQQSGLEVIHLDKGYRTSFFSASCFRYLCLPFKLGRKMADSTGTKQERSRKYKLLVKCYWLNRDCLMHHCSCTNSMWWKFKPGYELQCPLTPLETEGIENLDNWSQSTLVLWVTSASQSGSYQVQQWSILHIWRAGWVGRVSQLQPG